MHALLLCAHHRVMEYWEAQEPFKFVCIPAGMISTATVIGYSATSLILYLI